MEDVKESRDDTIEEVPKSSGSKDLGKTLPEEAFDNFLQGKRHMLVQDYSSAVQSLATACELYAKHFGELAIECGEVYFLYGKALFRLSQQQAGVLGGALNEGSNEENSTESEKDNESDRNSDGEAEGEEGEGEGEEMEGEEENETEEGMKEEKEPSESTDSPPTVVDEGSSEAKSKEPMKSTDEVSKKAESKSNAIVSETDECEENKKEEINDETQGAPEEDDLELAWNTLETAKSIFKRKDTIEAQLKVAEILLLLAEISMESDNNANAISDLKECLKIQKKHLKPDDRILAETYYQMGLALMLDKEYPEALENFRATKHILELRKENLKNAPVDEADGTFASADKEAEIADLESILVDIKEKIDDTEELISNKKKELEESSLDQAGSSSIKNENEKDFNITISKPVTNITHLLKRKKPDEGTTEDSAKRIKTSTGVLNGDSKVSEPEIQIEPKVSNTEG